MIKVRPNTVRDTVRGIFLGVLVMVVAVLLASPSKADGYLTPAEESFGDGISSNLCEYLDVMGVNRNSLSGAMRIIYENTPANMDMTDAVDIINYAVYSYCPGHWNELVAFGEGARS